jgi:hypothetical protein
MALTIQIPTQVKMISCSKCQGNMPELRLTQYGYNFCVNCSDGLSLVGKKRALPIQMGQGDHSWTETIIMEESDYLKYEMMEAINSKSKKKNKAEILNMESEERNLQGPYRIINNTPEEE